MFITLRTFSLPLKVLATMFLLTMGLGYLFGVTYLHLIEVEPHTKHGMRVVAALIRQYCGQRYTTGLEAFLEGPIPDYVTTTLKKEIAY